MGGPVTVLVADDRPEISFLTTKLLQDEGYATVSAGSAGEAVALAEKTPIDVALLDVVMHDGDVDDLVARIRSLRPAASVVLMSGYFSELLTRTTSLGPCSAILPKPFTRDQLLHAIQTALAPATES